METFKQKQRELREDVNSLKEGMDIMTPLLEYLVETQNQPSPSSQPQVTVISEITTSLVVSVVPIGPLC